MSLLTQQTTQSPGQYYFARASVNGVIEPSFTATGTIPGQVDFVAQGVQDTGVGFATAILIENNTPTPRWEIGVSGLETGGDSGSDLVIARVNDAGNTTTQTTKLSRSTGHLTEVGYVSSVAFADIGNSATLQGDYASATAGSSRVAFTARSGVGALQTSSLVCEGNFGQTQVRVVDPLGSSSTALTFNNDTTKNPSQLLGQANFTYSPLVGGSGVSIPYVFRETFADQFGGTATITITPADPATFQRPNILFTYSLTTANNDAANSASVLPAVQCSGFGAQTGITFGTAASAYDAYANSQDFLLVSGTHYNASTTAIVLTFAVTGRIVNNILSVKVVGMC
jgi:hypothetical protein